MGATTGCTTALLCTWVMLWWDTAEGAEWTTDPTLARTGSWTTWWVSIRPALAVATRRATTAIYKGKDMVTPAVEDNILYVTYEFEHFDLIFLSECCLLA